jgi:hypothetical protein
VPDAAPIAVRVDYCHIKARKSFSLIKMSDELDKTQADVTNGQSPQIQRDEAFCAHMHWAIEAGMENAPIGVVTTPGTKNPKYIATEPWPLVSSQRDMEHA